MATQDQSQPSKRDQSVDDAWDEDAYMAMDESVAKLLGGLSGPQDKAPVGVWDKVKDRIEEQLARDGANPGIHIAVSCTYCKGEVTRSEVIYCGSCLAPHHQDCFEGHGQCANLGCAETRFVQALDVKDRQRVKARGLADGDKLKIEPGRSRAPWYIAAALALGGGLGIAALQDEPQSIAVDPGPLPVKTKPQALRSVSLSRDLLGALETQSRLVLPEAIQDVQWDPDGYPWFTAGLKAEDHDGPLQVQFSERSIELREGASSAGSHQLLLIETGRKRYESGLDRIVVGYDILGWDKSDGEWIFRAPKRPNEGLMIDADGHELTLLSAEKLASRLVKARYRGPAVPRSFKLRDGERLLGTDRRAYIYVRRADQRLVVYNPWGAGQMPVSHSQDRRWLSVNQGRQLLSFDDKRLTLRQGGQNIAQLQGQLVQTVPLKNGDDWLLILKSEAKRRPMQKTAPCQLLRVGAKGFHSVRDCEWSKLLKDPALQASLRRDFDERATVYGPLQLTVDNQQCLWAVEHMNVAAPGEAVKSATALWKIDSQGRALRQSLTEPLAQGSRPFATDSSGLLVFEPGDKARLLKVQELQAESLRGLELAPIKLALPKDGRVFALKGQVWHRFKAGQGAQVSWQGPARAELEDRLKPLASDPRCVWLKDPDSEMLYCWDGQWSQVASDSITEPLVLCYDSQNQRMVSLELRGSILQLRLFNISKPKAKRRTVSVVWSCQFRRPGTDFVPLEPRDWAAFVADGELIFRNSARSVAILALPPRLDHDH